MPRRSLAPKEPHHTLPNPNAFSRLLDAHRAIKHNEPMNAAILAKRHDIEERTAARTFEYLRDRLFAPLHYDRRRSTYIYTDPTFELPISLMTAREAVALVRAHNALVQHWLLPDSEQLAGGMKKLQQFIKYKLPFSLPASMQRILVDPPPARSVDPEVIDRLSDAIDQNRVVEMEYDAATTNEHTLRQLDPYFLINRSGDWYAVGWCHLRKALRTFALGRVRKARIMPETFELPRDFDINDYFGDTVGVERGERPVHVVLEFDEWQARWVRERMLHPSQKISELPGKRIRLELDVALTTELKQTILSHGAHVRVVRPPQLAREIADMLAEALKQYR